MRSSDGMSHCPETVMSATKMAWQPLQTFRARTLLPTAESLGSLLAGTRRRRSKRFATELAIAKLTFSRAAYPDLIEVPTDRYLVRLLGHLVLPRLSR
jgi:hypothetical protein